MRDKKTERMWDRKLKRGLWNLIVNDSMQADNSIHMDSLFSGSDLGWYEHNFIITSP
jgi:hypothetical protein